MSCDPMLKFVGAVYVGSAQGISILVVLSAVARE